MSKTTKVLLEVPQHGIRQDFEFEHAERILLMSRNGGWVLPKDSKYTLTENGLQRRRNKKEANREQ